MYVSSEPPRRERRETQTIMGRVEDESLRQVVAGHVVRPRPKVGVVIVRELRATA